MKYEQVAQEFLDSEEIRLEKADPQADIDEWASQIPEDAPEPKAKFVTGIAGTGKTTAIRRAIEKKPKSAVMAATTGIAAVNMGEGVTTIHSLLGFFDEQSLIDNFNGHRLHRKMREVAKEVNWIAIDEVSMMSAKMLDYLYQTAKAVNALAEIQARGGFGLVLTGDFCQLPPVEGEYAFEADCWPQFDKNTTKLTKIWRQDNLEFIEALNAARRGDGKKTVEILQSLGGVLWGTEPKQNWDGTSLFALNKYVDDFNWSRLRELQGKVIEVPTYRWGRQRSEWNRIPFKQQFKEGALVMILANDTKEWKYANGSTGYIKCYSQTEDKFVIALRNGHEVGIEMLTRINAQRSTPDGMEEPEKPMGKREWAKEMNALGKLPKLGEQKETAYLGYLGKLTMQHQIEMRKKYGAHAPYYDFEEEKWIMGECSYHPIRLAWATSCHKSQGLTLEKVQIDFGARFFGEPSMAYVALSRVRSPEGLRIVGSPRLVESRVNVSKKVMRWL